MFKKICSVLLAAILTLSLAGCSNKPLTEPEYEFPKLSWGMSIKEVTRKYPSTVYQETDPYTVDTSIQNVLYTAETEILGHPAELLFGFTVVCDMNDLQKQNSYLVSISGTLYDWEDKDLLAAYENPPIDQLRNPNYIESEPNEKQLALAKENIDQISQGFVSYTPSHKIRVRSNPDTINNEKVYTFQLSASEWITYNIKMERP